MTRYSTLSPLPERIARLEELALDLWWSWHLEARIVFRRAENRAGVSRFGLNESVLRQVMISKNRVVLV